MREGLTLVIVSTEKNRITPAYAGRTKEWRLKYEKAEDHPRLCGKDFTDLAIPANAPGSPPLMREGRKRYIV